MYESYYPVTYYFYPLLEEQHSIGELRSAFQRHCPSDVETLLYVHIPYCRDMCSFCPFHIRIAKDEDVYERYIQALCRNIQQIAMTPRGGSSRLKAIYFGGGSPSVLSAKQIAQLLDCIKASFQLAPGVEISFEGEPKTLSDPARLEVLRNHGVQRISFGLQTYDESLRKHFNIASTLQDIERVRHNGREFGFEEINVDMLYNLPGQTIGTLERDIKRLLEDDFDSIDYYNLHYFAFSSKFKQEMSLGLIPPKPTEPIMLSLYEQLRYRLGEVGYTNVADQVFSRKKQVCEYFRLLWGGGYGEHRAETLAVGASARGYVDGYSYMLHSNVKQYIEAVENNELAVEKMSSALQRQENRGAVMFPKFLRIDKAHSEALSSIPTELLKDWLKAGLLYETESAYHISERGKIWNNNMTTDLFESAQRQVSDKAVTGLANKPGIRTGSF